MIGGQKKDDLSGTGHEMAARLLRFNGSQNTEKVPQHDAMSELALGVQAVDFTAVFGHTCERNDIVEIHAEVGVDVIDQSLNILLRSLVKGNDGKSGAATSARLENGLVVLDGGPVVARGGDDDVGAARQETLDDLYTNRAFPNRRSEERSCP